jgi:predicted HAD superfamily Cof-like phosphohydrolase
MEKIFPQGRQRFPKFTYTHKMLGTEFWSYQMNPSPTDKVCDRQFGLHRVAIQKNVIVYLTED